jgi:hypothetical protein
MFEYSEYYYTTEDIEKSYFEGQEVYQHRVLCNDNVQTHCFHPGEYRVIDDELFFIRDKWK